MVKSVALVTVIVCSALALIAANVDVPVADNVVNAPVLAVVAPTVPLMLMLAVPVRFVTVPLDGVPRAPPLTTNAPAVPVFTPNAVTTPVPVVVVLGVAAAPPPSMIALLVSNALVAQVDALEKYGMPPEVPATVKASVPDVVIGEPATEIKPPVKDCATLVTVPDPLLLKVVQSAALNAPRLVADAVGT